MRNSVAKKLKKVAEHINKDRAWYRRMKRNWNNIHPDDRHKLMVGWMQLMQAGGAK